MTPEGREQDAEDVVDVLSGKHGVQVDADPPRYAVALDAAACQALAAGGLDECLQGLLIDLVYDGAVRNLTLGWNEAGSPLPATTTQRLEIGDFLVLARDRALVAGQWYRIHAPAGYRCRPKGFA